MRIKFADHFEGRRLIARRIDEDSLAKNTATKAKDSGEWQYKAIHGGDVCNSYGYPAETECGLAISDPYGNCVVWVGRAPANKVTLRKAADRCLYPAGDLFDKRIKNQDRLEFTRKVMKKIHSSYWSDLEILASAAD
ncbi:MAG: hypothetical protein MN733_03510 [Nitrososphaera sp.]|nr:hypothetical protein [Nitrososphaera sp.]